MLKLLTHAFACALGGDSISQHIKVPNEQRCYFMVSKEGTPIKLQRKPFTECFYTMAFAELARATGNNHYMVRRNSTSVLLYSVKFS